MKLIRCDTGGIMILILNLILVRLEAQARPVKHARYAYTYLVWYEVWFLSTVLYGLQVLYGL